MRAVYLEQDIKNVKEVSVEGAKAHHLINVIRISVGENVLALDGEGGSALFEVTDVKKKSLVLIKEKYFFEKEKETKIDLAFCQVKKDALESVLKASVELGSNKVTILNSTFSQRYKLNIEKINKQMIAALEQSNNMYLPKLILKKLNEIDLTEYDAVLYFSSIKGEEGRSYDSGKKYLVIIGPEGGLSREEEEELSSKGAHSIKLDIPIMRTSTAVGCAFGYLLGKIKQ